MLEVLGGPGLIRLEVTLHPVAAWVAGFIEQKRRAAAETPAPAPAEAGKAESDET